MPLSIGAALIDVNSLQTRSVCSIDNCPSGAHRPLDIDQGAKKCTASRSDGNRNIWL
jgi:hypothetical protein